MGLSRECKLAEIFFSRAEKNRSSVFHIERLPGSWSEPRVASFSGRYNDSHPVFSPDGRYIVFCSRQKDGFGGTDLYVLYKESGSRWSAPICLGKDVNTQSVESSPTISLDGDFLFFSRKGDIWWVLTQVIDDVIEGKKK